MRQPSHTRVVTYRFEGDIDLAHVRKILLRAEYAGIITLWDSTKSAERGMDHVWFQGPAGEGLRVVRRAVAQHVR